MINIFIALVLILAWLGILTLVAFLAAILEAKLYNPQPRKTRQRHRKMVTQNHTCDQAFVTNMVTARPAISAGQQESQSPKVACNQAIEELMYQSVERFDDPLLSPEDKKWEWDNFYNPESDL